MNKHVKEITMLLLYMSSWEEGPRKKSAKRIRRAWKYFLPEILEEFEDKGYIKVNYIQGIILIKDKGWEKGKRLLKKYQEFRKQKKSKKEST